MTFCSIAHTWNYNRNYYLCIIIL